MDGLLNFLLYGAAAYIAYQFMSGSNASSTPPLSNQPANPANPSNSMPGQFSATPQTQTPQTPVQAGRGNPGGFTQPKMTFNPGASPITPGLFQTMISSEPKYTPTSPFSVDMPTPVTGPSMTDAQYKAQLQAIAANSAAQSQQLQQKLDADTAAYGASHATAQYCGPGCYVWYDANGNVTGQTGTPGSSATSLLNQSLQGVVGFDGR